MFYLLAWHFSPIILGAGNLVFPPMLGLQAGSHWLSSIVALAVSGVLLPILAIAIIGMAGGVTGITGHVSKNFHTVLVGAIMVFAMFISVPRTASVAIELGAQGVVPQTPYAPAVVLYFILVFFFARSKENVLDRIGKILTPLMAVILFVLVIRGFVAPIGTPVETTLESPFLNAFLGGYQTGDVLVSFLMASVFLGTITGKGYTEPKDRNRVTILAGVIAFCCLLVVYGGLLYMGACGSGDFPADIGNSELLVSVIKRGGGQFAMSALGRCGGAGLPDYGGGAGVGHCGLFLHSERRPAAVPDHGGGGLIGGDAHCADGPEQDYCDLHPHLSGHLSALPGADAAGDFPQGHPQ